MTGCLYNPAGFSGIASLLISTRFWRCTIERGCIALLVCTSVPVSRKKFLTMAHPLRHYCGRRNGLVARTSTHASWSDPTLSACCDGSQLLLGLTLLTEGSPIEDHPRHHHQSCVWRFGAPYAMSGRCYVRA
jgi:hypothetical protein